MASRPPTRSLSIDGLLLVDKPAGMSSHDVVLAARRALGERRGGHAGPLDPFAPGLLVLLVGRATRLLPSVDGDPKESATTIRFGAETDTDDLHGAVVREAPPPAADAVDRALPRLTGELDQLPPVYSAKRVAGRRAYDLAREGEVPELRPARVRVDGWRVVERRGAELDVVITCGGGTYIRALARDLGRLSGSAAHLTALRRLRSGPFTVRDAVPFEDLREARVALLPPERALGGTPAQLLDDEDVRRVVRGQEVDAHVEGSRAALMHSGTGALVALAVRRGDRWQPRVVMRRA